METSSHGLVRNEQPAAHFATTPWSVVLAAGRTEQAAAAAALEQLCHEYWFPIYAFIRRKGHDAHQAEDLTQGFFSRLLEKNWLEAADPDRGRFRTFLLTAVSRFLANEHDRDRALKRGGGQHVLSFDAQDAEGRPFELEADGMLAVCVQHETEHLEGKIFVDHLSALKRQRLAARLRKRQRLAG